MKFFVLLIAVFYLSGCGISQIESVDEEMGNIQSESMENADKDQDVEQGGDNKEIEQSILNSIYTGSEDRNLYDNGEYLEFGESMSMYVQMPEGNNEVIQEISVEDYFTIEVDDIELDQKRLDLYFILNLEEFAVENLQFGEKMTEVDATLFYGDVNLDNYNVSNDDESKQEGFRRFERIVTYDGKERFSCNNSVPGGEYKGNKRVCTLAFSYAGPGEYLLVISDKVGGFKNYLIEVE